jgi:type IV pilus assembly protein PilB
MDINAQIQLIGDLLISKEFISQKEINDLKRDLKKVPAAKQNFELLLMDKGLISEDKLLDVYSEYLGIPFIDLDQFDIDSKVVALIPVKFANKNSLIAVKKEDDVLTVALRNPFELNVIDELKTFTQLTIVPVISTSEEIQSAIKVYYGTGAETVEKLVQDSQVNDPKQDQPCDQDQNLDEIPEDATMVNYVNQVILEAIDERATDIHIEPFKNNLRIRYRVDGVLHNAKTPKDINKLHQALISRFKVMAGLNISEKRKPQDGRCKISLSDQEVDLRLSTFPTLHGEGLVIRILSGKSILLNLDQLGFSDKNFQNLSNLLKKPNGIILVTGPTGCGKTTTLYACINYINDSKVNIVTLEDPVEYQIDGVNQIQMNPKADLTFASGFRSVLRQDPDVILVGEIRDSETSQIAIRAALTGHLIFSTLHTNNALATLARLLDLGVEPYLLSSTLKAVMAQRLVRRICSDCKEEYKPAVETLKIVSATKAGKQKGLKFYRGKGCLKCGQTGYRGRVAIVELLMMDDHLNSLILKGDTKDELRKQAEDSGMNTIREDGIRKVNEGLTTIEEVIKVTE